ncbi:RlpA-like double-psi beta-barrel-protein domain-containing protein-containing protein, partial [Fennellomyces sp. T-0311]
NFHGKATWFIPSIHGGSMGACWEYEADDEYVVAMNSVQYGDMHGQSDWCFKKVRIYHDGKSVDAVVKDACPECKHGDLDLTPPVFQALGHLDTGILEITW